MQNLHDISQLRDSLSRIRHPREAVTSHLNAHRDWTNPNSDCRALRSHARTWHKYQPCCHRYPCATIEATGTTAIPSAAPFPQPMSYSTATVTMLLSVAATHLQLPRPHGDEPMT